MNTRSGSRDGPVSASERRVFDASRVPSPRDATPFPSGSPTVDLDVGCGVGLHPIQLAQQAPDRVIVGIERTKTRFTRFARRLAHHPQIGNVVPVCDDAVAWICQRVPPESVSRIFLLYPNPYPKPSQRNKRWYAMPFAARLIQCLTRGGTLQLATNVATYADEAKSVFVSHWGLDLLSETNQRTARTHFERKYLQRGDPCVNLVFRRPND